MTPLRKPREQARSRAATPPSTSPSLASRQFCGELEPNGHGDRVDAEGCSSRHSSHDARQFRLGPSPDRAEPSSNTRPGLAQRMQSLQDLPFWLPGLEGSGPDQAATPIQCDLRGDMKESQQTTFDDAATQKMATALQKVYDKGYVLQNNSGRIVYKRTGTFKDAKDHAKDELGTDSTTNRKKDSGETNEYDEAKELYVGSYESCNVMVRNFGSQSGVTGTIQINVGSLIIEFKNLA